MGSRYKLQEQTLRTSDFSERKHSLRRHKLTKHKEIKFYCDQCDYQFTKQQHLKKHKLKKKTPTSFNIYERNPEETQTNNLLRSGV